jgi:hypothetical protein
MGQKQVQPRETAVAVPTDGVAVVGHSETLGVVPTRAAAAAALVAPPERRPEMEATEALPG